jgi:acyl-CoA thioester hydrolase
VSWTAGTRDEYPYLLEIQTRWNDNDVYGHVNNVEYYGYFDTVINHWLITEGGLDIGGHGAAIGVCAESHCNYHEGLSFPERIEAGLRVAKLGNSSVRYEIAIFRSGDSRAGADGWFVHVFVDPASREPVPIPERIRASLKRLAVGSAPA